MIGSLLVANRGEIARRIIRTARRLGVRTIAVYSEADAGLPFVAEGRRVGADRSGQPGPVLSQRRGDSGGGQGHRCRGDPPGYGFLSENAEFARTVVANGLIWVGPGADAISAMGDKINARNLMAAAGRTGGTGFHRPHPRRGHRGDGRPPASAIR